MRVNMKVVDSNKEIWSWYAETNTEEQEEYLKFLMPCLTEFLNDALKCECEWAIDGKIQKLKKLKKIK